MWQSDGQRAMHLQLPTEVSDRATDAAAEAKEREAAVAPASPDQVAQRLLANITPSTGVSVRSPQYVAGRAAYALVLAPHSPASLVREVTAAIDAATGLATRVTVVAKGDDKPTVDLKFTSLTLKRPSAKTFDFKPPPGATVRQASGAGSLLAPQRRHHRWSREAREARRTTAAPDAASGAPTSVIGKDWDQVVVLSGIQLDRRFGELARAATRVTGPFGSGRLLRTKLVSALLLDDGRLVVGAVTPAALETAIANPH